MTTFMRRVTAIAYMTWPWKESSTWSVHADSLAPPGSQDGLHRWLGSCGVVAAKRTAALLSRAINTAEHGQNTAGGLRRTDR